MHYDSHSNRAQPAKSKPTVQTLDATHDILNPNSHMLIGAWWFPRPFRKNDDSMLRKY